MKTSLNHLPQQNIKSKQPLIKPDIKSCISACIDAGHSLRNTGITQHCQTQHNTSKTKLK